MSSKIKTYLVDYPIAFVEDIRFKIKMGILKKCRDRVFNYEINEYLNCQISDPYYGTPVSDLRVGVLSPVMIVTKMLEKHFGFGGYYRLRIHGIDVDTQGEEDIKVTIKLCRPGLLIGRSGKDISTMESLLGSYFNKTTKIRIVEVKSDRNMPMSEF